MKSTLRFALILYLSVLLVLALLPLTGYYAAALAVPVMAVYLYRRFILAEPTADHLVTRGIFLFALLVFVIGFALNLFCTLYTTHRMAEFRQRIEESKKTIYRDLNTESTKEQKP